MFMKLNIEDAEGFKRFSEKKVRLMTWGKRASVNSIVVSSVLQVTMKRCFVPGTLNRTFFLNQRSIARLSRRSERWIYEILKRLIKMGFIEKVGQKLYARNLYGPSIFKLGRLAKAWFFAFIKSGPKTYPKFLKRKRDLSDHRKQTSDFNLKKETNVSVFPSSSAAYSYIPDFKSFIKSLG